MSARPVNPWAEPEADRVEARIAIERDGTVIARSGKVEYGQGIRTGFARIVAEELDVPLSRVRVDLGETNRVPWDMGTFGSLSTLSTASAFGPPRRTRADCCWSEPVPVSAAPRPSLPLMKGASKHPTAERSPTKS